MSAPTPTLSNALARGLTPEEERGAFAVRDHLLSAAEGDPLLALQLRLKLSDPKADYYNRVYESQYFHLSKSIRDALDEGGWHLFNWGCWLATFTLWELTPEEATTTPGIFNALSSAED